VYSSYIFSTCIFFFRFCISGTALDKGLDDRVFESRQGLGISLSTTVSRPALEPTQPPIQGVPGALSLGIKWPVHKANHSLHLVPRSRMRGTIPPLHQYAFMAWCSIKAQEQLYLYHTTPLLLFYVHLLTQLINISNIKLRRQMISSFHFITYTLHQNYFR
jgi:hypothetical protein